MRQLKPAGGLCKVIAQAVPGVDQILVHPVVTARL